MKIRNIKSNFHGSLFRVQRIYIFSYSYIQHSIDLSVINGVRNPSHESFAPYPRPFTTPSAALIPLAQAPVIPREVPAPSPTM
jgi:hypothetical protein